MAVDIIKGELGQDVLQTYSQKHHCDYYNWEESRYLSPVLMKISLDQDIFAIQSILWDKNMRIQDNQRREESRYFCNPQHLREAVKNVLADFFR